MNANASDAGDNIVVVSNEDARKMVSKLYRDFNKLVALLRPFGIRVQHPVCQSKIDKAVYNLEILLDEVRELTK